MSDYVQNHLAIAKRNRTESSPGQPLLFFIGSSPSQAATIINPEYPAAGVMISVNQLRKRKSNFICGDWILDSGAFTEISKHGYYRSSVNDYAVQIKRWSECGRLLIAVSQDWMCEPFILERNGRTVKNHQALTIERYDDLIKLVDTPIMPVIQGYKISEYLSHVDQYGDRLIPGMWVGVGSVCKRNSDPSQIEDILASIKNKRPDLRLHGFGLKQAALESEIVRSLLYSCDSMAWSYPLRFKRPGDDFVQNPLPLAHSYQQGVNQRLENTYTRQIPCTAGAGNGQGRKPKWKSETEPVRLPRKYIARAVAACKQWEAEDEPVNSQ